MQTSLKVQLIIKYRLDCLTDIVYENGPQRARFDCGEQIFIQSRDSRDVERRPLEFCHQRLTPTKEKQVPRQG
ncbi:hypothetical protein [Burkholderia ubonensis]|uniref:hypothetical protein n=1 Tax=Burkholderia ubonensis TaxID=101571 RepID=UPI0012FBD755|nr:hypothetical protein [Burkholderia ubonensis]